MDLEVFDVIIEIEVVKKNVIKLLTLDPGSVNAVEIFDTITSISSSLNTIQEYTVELNNDRKRAENIASELRKKWGEQLSKECDMAGIK